MQPTYDEIAATRDCEIGAGCSSIHGCSMQARGASSGAQAECEMAECKYEMAQRKHGITQHKYGIAQHKYEIAKHNTRDGPIQTRVLLRTKRGFCLFLGCAGDGGARIRYFQRRAPAASRQANRYSGPIPLPSPSWSDGSSVGPPGPRIRVRKLIRNSSSGLG